jgi:hypothetical protein
MEAAASADCQTPPLLAEENIKGKGKNLLPSQK